MDKKSQNNCSAPAPTRWFAYCADCDKDLGESTAEHKNTRVVCSPENPEHWARVVKGPAGKSWLKVERFLMRWEHTYSPRCWFPSWKVFFKGRAGYYMAMRLVLILLVCMALVESYVTTQHWCAAVASWILGLLFLADLVLFNTANAFVTRDPANPLRSVIFAFVGLITLSSIFALFFLSIPDHFTPRLDFVSAIYFSLVTIATLGYGDIHPRDYNSFAQLVVSVEVILGGYFVMTIIAIVTAWTNDPRWFHDPVPLHGVLLKKDGGAKNDV
jgi:hypothetical protein